MEHPPIRHKVRLNLPKDMEISVEGEGSHDQGFRLAIQVVGLGDIGEQHSCICLGEGLVKEDREPIWQAWGWTDVEGSW